MEVTHRKSIDTITGIFSTPENAEQAYQTLLNLGYGAGEITLMMSENTFRNLHNHAEISLISGIDRSENLQVTSIPEAVEAYGRFVSIPGLALVMAYNHQDDGFRALSGSVLSDDYAEYFQKRIQDGEILIDFGLHAQREKRLVTSAWGHCGGYPLIRKMRVAA